MFTGCLVKSSLQTKASPVKIRIQIQIQSRENSFHRTELISTTSTVFDLTLSRYNIELLQYRTGIYMYMNNLTHHFSYMLHLLMSKGQYEDTSVHSINFLFFSTGRQLFLGISPFISDPGYLCLLVDLL